MSTDIIVEEFNVYDWGGHAQARRAQRARGKWLYEQGYQVFYRDMHALNTDYTGYQLVAFIDAPGLIRPKLPPPKGTPR